MRHSSRTKKTKGAKVDYLVTTFLLKDTASNKTTVTTMLHLHKQLIFAAKIFLIVLNCLQEQKKYLFRWMQKMKLLLLFFFLCEK